MSSLLYSVGIFFASTLAIPSTTQALWIYKQSTGELYHQSASVTTATVVAKGYSGIATGRNNPALECQGDIGPLPAGAYYISEKTESVTTDALRLAPKPSNNLCNGTRNGFLIHGDRVLEAPLLPGTASHGCIILPKAVRIQIWESNDRDLKVVP
jgi:hypothetical protein